MEKRGWIALDIDGTITLDKYSVPHQVTSYLRSLSCDGWNIALATGRPFAFAAMALTGFDFPYFFLAQNGSVALEMPQKRLLFKSYIPPTSLPHMERAYEGVDSDFLVYRGYDRGDACFWRPQKFSTAEKKYLADLQTRQKEHWQEVAQFPHEAFPLIKCFGSEELLHRIARFLRSTHRFEVAHIRDPFVAEMYLLLVTDIHTSKGKSLLKIFELKGRGAQVIAAGDDENDLSLLGVADTKIAMQHAPAHVKKVADIIAPPTAECGIIAALKEAINR